MKIVCLTILVLSLLCFQKVAAQQDSLVAVIVYPPTNVFQSDTLWLKVEWLGWIQFLGEYRGIDPGFYGNNPPPHQFYRKDIQIGLREDGVVVWRKKK